MGRQQGWLRVSLTALSGWLLTGCTSLPEYAVPPSTLSRNLSTSSEQPVARPQMPDGPLPDPKVARPTPPATGGGAVPASFADRGTVRVSVRAWVNGRAIFEEELRQWAARGLDRAAQTGKEVEHVNERLNELIDQELVYQDAVKKLEKFSPRALEQMRDFVHQEFEKSLKKMREANVPEAEIRRLEPIARKMRERDLISAEYARSKLMPGVKAMIGLSQIREFYETHLDDFKAEDMVQWKDIFIPISPNLPTIEHAKRFAEELINKCRRPEDLERLMVYDERRIPGCEGFGNKKGQIRPAEVEAVLFDPKLPANVPGPVVALATGVHIVWYTKREFAHQRPLDEDVQKVIRRRLEGEFLDREYRRLVHDLKQRAVIEIERALP